MEIGRVVQDMIESLSSAEPFDTFYSSGSLE